MTTMMTMTAMVIPTMPTTTVDAIMTTMMTMMTMTATVIPTMPTTSVTNTHRQ